MPGGQKGENKRLNYRPRKKGTPLKGKPEPKKARVPKRPAEGPRVRRGENGHAASNLPRKTEKRATAWLPGAAREEKKSCNSLLPGGPKKRRASDAAPSERSIPRPTSTRCRQHGTEGGKEGAKSAPTW